MRQWLLEHLHDHYGLYGEHAGVRTARKHIGWAVHGLPGGDAFRRHMNTLTQIDAQVRAVSDYFEQLSLTHDRLPVATGEPLEDNDAQGNDALCAAH